MASVFLKRRELRGGGRLPDVCLVCGAHGRPTEVTLRHKSGFFGINSGVTITTFVEAVLPLCPEHRDYFDRLNTLALAAFGVLALLLLTAAACFFAFGLKAFAPFFLLFVFCALAFGFASVLVTMSRTRASRVEDRGVWLANVAEDFAAALEDQRDGIAPERAPRRRRTRGGPAVPAGVWLLGAGGLVLLLGCGGLGAFFLLAAGGDDKEGGQPWARAVELNARPAGGAAINPRAPATRVTVENFRKLKVDMTTAEVLAILGPPSEDAAEVPAKSWFDGPNMIQVFFRDDRVTMVCAFINGQQFSLPALPSFP
jgi:hypothetical protein